MEHRLSILKGLRVVVGDLCSNISGRKAVGTWGEFPVQRKKMFYVLGKNSAENVVGQFCDRLAESSGNTVDLVTAQEIADLLK